MKCCSANIVRMKSECNCNKALTFSHGWKLYIALFPALTVSMPELQLLKLEYFHVMWANLNNSGLDHSGSQLSLQLTVTDCKNANYLVGG